MGDIEVFTGENRGWISPEEAMKDGFIVRESEAGRSSEGVCLKILRFVDYDGKQITLPRFVKGEAEKDIAKALKKFGHPMQTLEVSELNKTRLEKCLKELKLPMLLAMRLAFDRVDIDLNSFEIPDSGAKNNVIVAVRSLEPNSGKSLFCAMMEWRHGIKAFSLDVFSGLGPKEYIEEFEKRKLGKEASFGDLHDVVKQMHAVERIKKNDRPPLGDLLDDMIEYFRTKKERPGCVLLEGMSLPKKDLTSDAYAIATRDSCEVNAFLDKSVYEAGLVSGVVDQFFDTELVLEDLEDALEEANFKRRELVPDLS